MNENMYHIGKIRVRNSSLGRVKEIHFKTEENRAYYLDMMLKRIRADAYEYFSKYNLPYFRPEFIAFSKPVHSKHYMERHIPYLQGTYTVTTTKYPENYFKSDDEVEDYLMKYFFTSSVEYSFFNYIKRCNDQVDSNTLYSTQKLSELEIPIYVLKKARIVDLKAEYKKYKETGHSDLPIILYSNWKKYKENKNWLKEEIAKSEKKLNS